MIYRIHDGHLSRLILEGINHADHVVTGEPPTRLDLVPDSVTGFFTILPPDERVVAAVLSIGVLAARRG